MKKIKKLSTRFLSLSLKNPIETSIENYEWLWK